MIFEKLKFHMRRLGWNVGLLVGAVVIGVVFVAIFGFVLVIGLVAGVCFFAYFAIKMLLAGKDGRQVDVDREGDSAYFHERAAKSLDDGRYVEAIDVSAEDGASDEASPR